MINKTYVILFIISLSLAPEMSNKKIKIKGVINCHLFLNSFCLLGLIELPGIVTINKNPNTAHNFNQLLNPPKIITGTLTGGL